MAEELLRQVKALDRSAARLEERRREVEAQHQALEREAETLTRQCAALCEEDAAETSSEDVAGSDEAPMTWERLKQIPESPVGSISVASFQSALEMEMLEAQDLSVSESEESTLQTVTVPEEGLRWESFHVGDVFSDPRSVEKIKAPENVVLDERVPEESETSSAVESNVLELLRRMERERGKEDRTLGKMYMRKKRELLGTGDDSAMLTQYRFPLTEYEEWKRVVGLWGEEMIYEMWHQIPDQETSSIPKTFVDQSRLVVDPEREALQNLESRPWSTEEKRIFLEKFMEHPKDFYKIAKALPYRTTGDCVQFFYANKKSEFFTTIRRKQQLKKRRLQSESNRELFTAHLLTAKKRDMSLRGMNDYERKREIRSWIMERLANDEVEFTDEQLVKAVEKYGFNYKALAKEVGCSKPSFVGGYLLVNWRKFGLDEYFQTANKSMNQPCRAARWLNLLEQGRLFVAGEHGPVDAISHQQNLDRTISAPAHLMEDVYRHTRHAMCDSYGLADDLMQVQQQEEVPKVEANNQTCRHDLRTPAMSVMHQGSYLSADMCDANQALSDLQAMTSMLSSTLESRPGDAVAAVPPSRFQPTDALLGDQALQLQRMFFSHNPSAPESMTPSAETAHTSMPPTHPPEFPKTKRGL